MEVVYSQQALSTAVQQTQIQMFIVFGFILVIYILLNVFFIPYYTKQFKAGMFKHDFLNDVGDRKMYSDLGEKRKPSDVLYRMTGFLGKKKIPHLDPTRWDQGTGVKWGPIPVVRFFAVGKAYPKVVPKMLAAEANLAVAQTPIDEDEVKRIEVYKNVHSGGLDKLKEALKVKEKPAWKEEYKSEIIRHNKYLHHIAVRYPRNALILLTCDQGEIPFYTDMFLLSPEGKLLEDLKLTDGSEQQFTQVHDDLVKEIAWVREYCSTLPKEINLATTASIFPDRNTTTEIIETIDAQNENEKRDEKNKTIYILAGVCVIFGIVELITIALLTR